jgi:hypothetical protein
MDKTSIAAFVAGLTVHFIWDIGLVAVGLLFGWRAKRRCGHNHGKSRADIAVAWITRWRNKAGENGIDGTVTLPWAELHEALEEINK